jgi:signal transduction histidine kinase/ligand-binding sensor domain-containing protein
MTLPRDSTGPRRSRGGASGRTSSAAGAAPPRVISVVVVTATAAVLAALIGAAPLIAERLIIRAYNVADGLPGSDVGCLVTDRDGFLWICLRGGLARFDGVQFVNYGTAEGLPDPVINHFLHGRGGTRWVATNGGGIARLEPGVPGSDGRVFTAFPVGSSPRSMRVNVLYETAGGLLFAGTDGGLYRARAAVREPRFEAVPLAVSGHADGGLQIWALTGDDTGRIWAGTSAGVVLIPAQGPPIHLPVAPAQGADHVYTILLDEAGRLWLGHDAGLFVWVPPTGGQVAAEGTSLQDVATACAPAGEAAAVVLPDSAGAACRWSPAGTERGRSRVPAIAMAHDGWIWLTSYDAVVAFDGERIRRFSTGNALSSMAWRMGVDAGGDVWLGTRDGAYRVLRRGFAHFTAEDGVPQEEIRRVMRGPDGQLYAVTEGSTLVRLDGERWTAVQPRLPPLAGVTGRSRYGAALLDRTGAWWIGTGEGLLRYPPVRRLEDLAAVEPAARYTTADGMAGDVVWHLHEDTRGDIWIATRIPGRQPLTRWERSTGRFHRYGEEAGLPAERAVASFAETSSGILWVSLWDGGLARFDGERFQYLEPPQTLPADPRTQLVVDRNGWLWVGGRRVLFSRDPAAPLPRFEEYRTKDGRGLAGEALALDTDDWVVASTFTGLVRIHASGDLQQIGGGVPVAGLGSRFHRDPDGTLWIPWNNHILRYTPVAQPAGPPPPIWIGRVRVAGAPLPVPAMGATSLPQIRLRPDQRQIQVDWFSLDFGVEERLRFQFRLDGADGEWSRPTSDQSVVYASLPPGRYRFLVRALNAAGEASIEPATLAFVVPPPFHRSRWFLVVLATSVALLLVAIHRARLRRVLELERMRSRIAADLHDEIGANLVRVSLLTEATRRAMRTTPDTAEAMLGEIGETSRSLVTAVGDVAFCIDPGRGALDAFIARVRRFGDDLLSGSAIDWEFRVHGETTGIDLTSDQRRHLLAIVKEALRNALRHADARRITLTLVADASSLRIELSDDGRGLHEETAAANGGQGLRNMRHRATELGGDLRFEAPPGVGTRLVLELPLGRPHRMSMQ